MPLPMTADDEKLEKLEEPKMLDTELGTAREPLHPRAAGEVAALLQSSDRPYQASNREGDLEPQAGRETLENMQATSDEEQSTILDTTERVAISVHREDADHKNRPTCATSRQYAADPSRTWDDISPEEDASEVAMDSRESNTAKSARKTTRMTATKTSELEDATSHFGDVEVRKTTVEDVEDVESDDSGSGFSQRRRRDPHESSGYNWLDLNYKREMMPSTTSGHPRSLSQTPRKLRKDVIRDVTMDYPIDAEAEGYSGEQVSSSLASDYMRSVEDSHEGSDRAGTIDRASRNRFRQGSPAFRGADRQASAQSSSDRSVELRIRKSPSTPPKEIRSRPQTPDKLGSEDGTTGRSEWPRRESYIRTQKIDEGIHQGELDYSDLDHQGTAGFPTEHEDLKCHPYVPPTGENGEPLSIDISIRNVGNTQPSRDNAAEPIRPWPVPISRRPSPTEHQPVLLNIVGAKRCFASSHHTLDIDYSPGSTDETPFTERAMKWLHVERQRMDFMEFKSIVMGTPNLRADWRILLLILLKRIEKKDFYQSRDLFRPWTLRADSSELGLGADDAILSATSISFPYFALGPKNTDVQNPVMSLFEWDARFECAKEWDSEQSISRLKNGLREHGAIIRVPHVWALTFDDTIITYGQVAFNDIVDNKSIKMAKLDSNATGHASWVRVTDLEGRRFNFSLEHCHTFFALKQSIKLRCFPKSPNIFEYIDIFSGKNEPVNGEAWVNVRRREGISVIQLWLRRKESISNAMGTSELERPSECIMPYSADCNTDRFEDGSVTSQGGDGTADGDRPLRLSSESHRSVNERGLNATAPISRPSCPTQEVAHPGNGALVSYKPMELAISPRQTEFNNTVLKNTIWPGLEHRKRTLEEKGIIVFDRGAIQASPKIYAPPSRAVVRSGLPSENVSTRLQDPSTYSSMNERDFETDGLDGDDPYHKAVSNESNSHSGVTIPHFLSWATSQEPIIQETSSDSSIHSTVKMLDMAHDTLLKVKPSKYGRSYRCSQEKAHSELKIEFPILQRLNRDPRLHTSSNEPVPVEHAKGILSLLEGIPYGDRVRAALLRASIAKLDHLYTLLNDLLSLYVLSSSPSVSDHPLVKRYWGAFGSIMAVIISCVQNETQERKAKQPEWCIVRDPSALSMLSNHRKPIISWNECKNCRIYTKYPSFLEALKHVRSCHFGLLENDEIMDEELVTLWVRNENEYYDDHRLELCAHYLGLIVDPLRDVCRKGRCIWEGVASDNISMPSRFLLPESLVRAFENAVLLVVCAAKSFPIIGRGNDPRRRFFIDAWSDSKDTEDRNFLEAANKDLLRIGFCAKEFMNKAEQDVMLMAYTDMDTETVSYESVGPEYILATIMNTLFNRPLQDDEPVEAIYARIYHELHLQAMMHPRTRLLSEIWHICQELRLVEDVKNRQQQLMIDYRLVLMPYKFRATTRIRSARFEAEDSFIMRELRQARSVSLQLHNLISRLHDMTAHVSRMRDIQEENNGNAILVFTIVTIIFLPLSWATSYLGMNTSDIRSLSNGQWVYWAISIPVAAVVIGVAVLVVLKGESIREFFIKRQIAKLRQNPAGTNLSHPKTPSTRMKDTSLVRRQSTMISGADLWGGFRRRTTNLGTLV